jgi:predicted TPR repeat methyltransferase
MVEQAGRLARSSSLALAPAEDGYWVYDVPTSRLHHLNPLAALILELSDGSHTAEEIAAEVAPFLTEGNENACVDWIRSAVANGLLQERSDSAQPSNLDGTSTVNTLPELTAADFATTADKLRGDGYVLAAFVCQQHATILSPDNEDFWYDLGEIGYMLGKREDARIAYERYLSIHGSDAEMEHILISLRDEPAPPRASDSCIKELYSRFSRTYDKNMVGELNYSGPARMTEMLDAQLGSVSDLKVLDMGCGTGLAGKELRPRANYLAGIDLSPEMIAKAQETGAYDTLEVAEITSWLSSSDQPLFSLITAMDCFIYFGDLRQVLIPAARRLMPEGRILFSVESNPTVPFRLTDSGRYRHSKEHIESVATEAGMVVERIVEGFLRWEFEEAVQAFYVLLRRAEP